MLRDSRFCFVVLSVLCVLTTACGPEAMTDAGVGRDSGMMCMSGMHLCGSECQADGIDDPTMGCRKGCGTACPVPTGGAASCAAGGTCDVMCAAPYVKSGSTCMCRAQSCGERGAQCGAATDGCGGNLDCGMCGVGQVCEDNLCACAADTAEPNERDLDAFMLGDFPDQPDTSMTFEMFALQSAEDVDFYRVRVIDAAMMNPTVRVELRMIPPGSDFELGAWYTCDSGDDTTRCDDGVEDTSFGPRGCLSETPGTMPERVQLSTFCGGTSETGNLIIRVQSTVWTNACMPYQLIVTVS